MSQNDPALKEIYVRIGVPSERLPYTQAKYQLVHEYNARTSEARTPEEVYHELTSLRKNGQLPRLGRGRR